MIHVTYSSWEGVALLTNHLLKTDVYERSKSLWTSDVVQRFTREPRVYRLAKYLQGYFHVRRPPSDERSIFGYFDE